MKKTVFFLLAFSSFFAVRAQTIRINSTDVVGLALPLQIDDDISSLTYGSNTFGRQIRLSRLQNTYFFDIGLDNSNHFFITKPNSGDIAFKIGTNGNIGIGTINPGSFKLAVEGKIGAREIKVTLQTPWPDYVFNNTHQLMSLARLEAFIQKNNHLPNIPSAQEVKENGGIDLGEMNTKLLEKVEELTLHMIEINKRLELLEKENTALKKASK